MALSAHPVAFTGSSGRHASEQLVAIVGMRRLTSLSFRGHHCYAQGSTSLAGDFALGLDIGAAMGAIKHSIPGDLPWITRDEVNELLRGQGLRIRR